MIDEKGALKAAEDAALEAMNDGKNHWEVAHAVVEAYEAARSAEPVAWPDVYRVRAHGNWLYFTDAETAHGSAEMHGTVAHPLYAAIRKEAPDV